MNLVVTAENGSFTSYDIKLDRNNSDTNDIAGPVNFEDTDNNKNSINGKITFTGLRDESVISEYYYEIWNELNDKVIAAGYIPKNSTKNYLVNVPFNASGILELVVMPVDNYKKLFPGCATNAYDGPIDTTNLPSLAGIVIQDFTDTNNESGKISNNISFTKANDEKNIAFYKVQIVVSRFIGDPNHHDDTDKQTCEYYILADGSQSYSLKNAINYMSYPIESINALGATKIEVVVTPKNRDGISVNGRVDDWYISDIPNSIKKEIKDLPDVQVEVKAPVLEKDPNNDFALKVTNVLPAARVYLYKYNAYIGNYEKVKDENGIDYSVRVNAVKNDTAAYINYETPGRYKVKQLIYGNESDFSNEYILKAKTPNAIVVGNSIMVTGVINGAEVRLADANNNRITTLVAITTSSAIDGSEVTGVTFNNLADGTYYLTQVYRDSITESDRREVVISTGNSNSTTNSAISLNP